MATHTPPTDRPHAVHTRRERASHTAVHIHSKAAGGSLGSAVAGLLWFLAVVFIDPVAERLDDPQDMATAVGFSSTILTFIFAYSFRGEA